MIICFISGGALVGMGLSGLFASNFPPRPSIYLGSIFVGVVLMIPPCAALKMGFAPKNPAQKPKATAIPQKNVGEKQIEREKAACKKKVPEGYYSKFTLSNGNLYYVGFEMKRTSWYFWEQTKCIDREYLPNVDLSLIPSDFPNLIFRQV